MNFIEEFKKGQAGSNKGLYMGKGLSHISKAINGIQKGRLYGVAGASKSGKSTFVDYAFVIQPFLNAIEKNIEIEWIYFSFELNRISKEFDFMSYFLNHDYNIDKITLDEGITFTYKGISNNYLYLSPDYLRGRLQDDNGNLIKVKNTIVEAMKTVYTNRIIPLFGEFDINGNQVKKGLINFCVNRDNPTGLYVYIKNHAIKNGKLLMSDSGNFSRIIGYTPNNPDKYTIIILDHIRKLIRERGFQMKDNVDKTLEYMCEQRDLFNYTFVPIIHTNRSIGDIETIRHAKDELYPNEDSIKDSGNMSEDCDYLFTIFNPNDEKFKLQSHFGFKIKDVKGNPLYLNMRTIHLVQSRHCIFPQHFRTEMIGNLKTFKQLKINN